MRIHNAGRYVMLAVLLHASVLSQPALAQRGDSATPIDTARAQTIPAMSAAAVTRRRGDSSGREAHVAHYTLAGAGIGAATGFIVAKIMTMSPKVTDHSEDGLGEAIFSIFGAFAGLFIGFFAGLLTGS